MRSRSVGSAASSPAVRCTVISPMFVPAPAAAAPTHSPPNCQPPRADQFHVPGRSKTQKNLTKGEVPVKKLAFVGPLAQGLSRMTEKDRRPR
jgi:hypothetical protein